MTEKKKKINFNRSLKSFLMYFMPHARYPKP